MKRILITGSSGFIGNELVRSFAEEKNNLVYAVDKKQFQ